MSSYNQQDQLLLNWLHSCHEKAIALDSMFADSSTWSSYSSPDTTPVPTVPHFQPAVYEDSPVMATPYLDSGCFSPASSNHTHYYNISQTMNIPMEQYLGAEDDNSGVCGPAFTGNPMELLLNKSKGVNTSPTSLSSPCESVDTPLFGPIGSADNDDGSSNQQYGLHQQDIDAFLQENQHPFEIKRELTDWSCDVSLFDELEGIANSTSTNTTTTTDTKIRATTTTTTNKRKRDTNSGKGTKKGTKKSTTTKHDDQQDDDDEDDDNKNNKKRPATKTQKTDQGEKRYGCPICRRKFARRYNLNTHIRTHNANRIKEFVCEICNYGFDRKHDRDRHQTSVHHGQRDYACEHCDASFCRRDALLRHTLKSHPDDA